MVKAMQTSKSNAVAPQAPARKLAAESPVPQAAAKGGRPGRRTRRAAKALSGAAADQLRAGTELLAQAMSHFAANAHAGGGALPAGELRNAYASIVQFLPKQARLTALGAMRESIDEVARAESDEPSVEQRRGQGVSTADFMAGLKLQEQTEREREIAAGDLVPGTEMQRRLQISAQALSTALKRKRIFALKGPAGKYHYPAFFADSRFDRTTLERVCQALGDLPGSSKLHFFTSPRQSLGGLSPLQALVKGRVDAVLDQAAAFLEA